MDKPSVYIETSIVSYLAADPSRHPVTLRNQRLTHAWWNTRRDEYALWTSSLTLSEAARGDEGMSTRRLELLEPIRIVATSAAATALAKALWSGIPLPDRAKADAWHIALAASNGLAYLLTWDGKHIANPRFRSKIASICAVWGHDPPVFCTPAELMGVE